MNSSQIGIFRKKLREIERAVGLRNKNEAVCCGVSLAQCHAILEIGMAGEINIKELSSVMGLDKSTLSRTVDNLVHDRLAERGLNPKDRRFITIHLTPKGKKVHDRINAVWNGLCIDLFKKMPVEKRRQILDAITLVADALSKMSQFQKLDGHCCSRKE
jgi:DNA-binding MarR family transcriptional regulator